VTGVNTIQSATFERGVESITLACGTGAVAAAVMAQLKNKMSNPVEVHVPGGKLKVLLSKAGATLTGEARFICEGFILSEALL
jgi:diaminopimelate epimerase